ncbi:MAG TPA: hypothetical protein VJ201_08035 [Candidatus Babeliales bacterium]|nr:hypothetical protein [Candidatus Babeliales bacterium]
MFLKKYLLVVLSLSLISSASENSSSPVAGSELEIAKGAKMIAAGITAVVSGIFANRDGGDVTLLKEFSKIGVFLGIFAIFDIYRGHSLVGLVKDTTLIALAYKALNNEPIDDALMRLARKKKVFKHLVSSEEKRKTYDTDRLLKLLISYQVMKEFGIISH